MEKTRTSSGNENKEVESDFSSEMKIPFFIIKRKQKIYIDIMILKCYKLGLIVQYSLSCS